MDRWKAEQGRGREKRKIRRKKSRRKKSKKKEDADAWKGRKVAKHCVFPMIWGSGGSKSRLAKAAGAEPAGQMRDEKLHAVVARSTFRSQNVQNTSASDHFWKLRCRKSARRCGAKHISKSKCTKHTRFGPLLEVEMSKKCTPLWREAHFQVKMYKTHQLRTTFGSWDVEKVHAIVARSTFPSQNVQNTPGVRGRFRCRKSARRCGAKHIQVKMSHHIRVAGARDCAPCQKWAKREGFVAFSTTTTTTSHYTPIQYTTQQLQLQLHLHYIPLHYTPLHYTALNYTQLHYTTLQVHYTPLHYNYTKTTLHYTYYATLHYTTLHYTTLHSTTLHYTTLHYTTLHYTTLHYTSLHLHLHYTPLHSNYNYTTQLHSTTLPLHSTTLHYTTLHYTTLHYTTLHSTTLHYTEWHCTTDRQVDR